MNDTSPEVTTVTYMCDEWGGSLGSRRNFLSIPNIDEDYRRPIAKLYVGDIVKFSGLVVVNGDLEEIQDKTFGAVGFVARADVTTIEILKKSR